MRSYASSRLRVILLAGMLLAAGVVAGTRSFAQSPATAPGTSDAALTTPAEPKAAGLFTMILSRWWDPVFIIILLLSITGLTLIIQGFIKNRESVLMPEETTNLIREMIAQRRFKELIEFTETDPSFISKSLNPALKRAPIFSSMKEAMETSIGEQTAEQFRSIEYLNIIGNLGPLLGLLGTVLGMIDAFSVMQASGSANPSQLAGGVSTALTHTFLGLFLAVPCLGAFGVLRTMVDRLTVRGALISEELLLMIKPMEAKPAMAAPVNPTAAPRAVPQPSGIVPQPQPIMAPPPPPATTIGRKPSPINPMPAEG